MEERAVILIVTLLQILLCSRSTNVNASALGTSPRFIIQPSNQIAHGSASIPCSASGSPQPSIEWFKGGSAVQLDNRLSIDSLGYLQISNLQNSDAGDYHCRASNAVGSVRSTTAELRIAFFNTLPASSPQQLSVTNFNPVTLVCTLPASLPNPPTVEWTPTVNQLSDGRVGMARDGRLIFSYFDHLVDATDLYICRVGNDVVGTTQASSRYFFSSSGTPQLFHAVAFVIEPTPSQTLVTGETLYLECFTTGRPVATISWEKDRTTLMNGGRVSITQGGRSFSIDSTSSGDEGTYTCVAVQVTNSGNVEIRASGVVTVIVPPRITSSFHETSATVTQPLSLNCMAAEGTPPLEWVWLFNSEPIGSSGVSTTEEGSTLTINEVGAQHGGVYQCTVTQPATGRSDNSNELVNVVSIPPSFTHGQTLDDQLAVEGGTVTFPCLAVGFPTPAFSWFRAGQTQPINLDGPRYSISSVSGDGSLTISSAEIGDSSLFSCRASNSAGNITSQIVTLRVIAVPVVTNRPPTSITPSQGTQVTLLCSLAPVPSHTISYQWTLENEPITMPHSEGTLTINNFAMVDNGVYQCNGLISVAGVGATPLTYNVGSSVVTVGAPPEAPSQPLGPSASSIATSSFTAHWTTPTSNGGLPLRNYSVEISNSGISFCASVDRTWRVVVDGIDPTATVAMVTGLSPFTLYQFRVTAFNYEFTSVSSPAVTIQTLPSAPQAPPTTVQATTSSEQNEIDVSWQMPSPCSSHGGPLTTYTIEFRVQSQGVWHTQDVGGVSSTHYTLTDLQPDTMYEVRVAAHTSEGQGVFSRVVVATTLEAPLVAPTQFNGLVVNSSAVSLSWVAPANQNTDELLHYTVTYTHPDGRHITATVMGGDNSTIITNLIPGSTYTFQVAAVYMTGETSPPATDEVFLPGGPTTAKPIFEEVWFIPTVAVVGVLVITFFMVVVAVICFKCCWKCGSDDGKIYFTSRRSASSMSGGSSGFSEFQHKHNKVNAISRNVKIHSSPTPSRRSTDYADMDSLRPAHSMTAPSFTCTDSLGSEHRNGRAHYPHRGHMIPDGGHMMSNGGHRVSHEGFIDDPNDQMHMYPRDQTDYPIDDQVRNDANFDPNLQERHIRHMSSGANQQFIDTLNRVHTPPPPVSPSPDQFLRPGSSPRGYTGLSQETSDSWNPADNLNPRGHMTNKPVSRSNSGRSSHTSASGRPQLSSTCSTPQKMDLAARKRGGPLSPVHEQMFNNRGMSHDNHMITNQGMSMQQFPHRANTVSHGNMSRSMGQIAHPERHMSHGAQSLSSQQFRQPPIGMELGTMTPDEIQQRQLPAIPRNGMKSGDDFGMEQNRTVSPIPNQHSVEYSSIPPIRMSHSESLTQPQDNFTHYPQSGQSQRPINYYPPPNGPLAPPTQSQRYSPEDSYPLEEFRETRFTQPPPHYNQPQLSQPDLHSHLRQQSSPPHLNYPSSSHVEMHTRQISSPPLVGNVSSQMNPSNRSSSPVYSAPQVKPKPASRARRNFSNDMPGFSVNNSISTPNVTNGFEQIPVQSRTQAISHSQQVLDSESALKIESNGIEPSEESWPLDDLQQQFENDILDLEAMQNMLTPLASDSKHSFQTLEDQMQVVAMNDGGPVYPNSAIPASTTYNPPQPPMHRQQSVPAVLPKPKVAPKPHIKSIASLPNGPAVSDTLETSLNGTNGWPAEDPNSLAINKLRPSIPDLTQLKRLDPRTPKIKQGKVPGSIWQPRSMNKAIESSSDESDTDSDFSMADTVVEPGDNTSLRSSHV